MVVLGFNNEKFNYKVVSQNITNTSRSVI